MEQTFENFKLEITSGLILATNISFCTI